MKQAQPPHVGDVIHRFGGAWRVAQILGLNHATVTYWQDIPLRYVADLARAIGCRPSEIRPELAELFELEQNPVLVDWREVRRAKADAA